jgi:2-polyprenyl-3-methyl-5-hydroxy-6-metoxy-1,4-benzoquinol methylase
MGPSNEVLQTRQHFRKTSFWKYQFKRKLMEPKIDFEFDPPLEKCVLCGETRLVPYHLDFRGIHISKCMGCGIQLMNPQYSDRYLVRYYSQYGWEGGDELDLSETYQQGYHFYLSLVEKFKPQRGKILDIGAGRGGLLVAAKERGWSPTGYDVEGETTRQAAKQWGLPYVFGNFTQLPWEPASFDAVFMHHVLEHLKSPVTYLQTIHRLLKVDGVLFLALPNIGSLSTRFKFLLEKAGMRKKRVGAYYDTNHHLLYFTPGVLSKLLQAQGFEALHLRSGHQIRPGQSKWKRLWMRNVTERLAWKSSTVLIVRKQDISSSSK